MNELGNTISLSVEQKEIAGIDGVNIAIEGPSSETTLHVTRMEAEMLVEQITKCLSYGRI